jgi:hypothetical protein
MLKNKVLKERVTFFLLGALAVFGMLFLLGADNAVIIDNGRYQLSSWAGSFGKNSGGVGAFIVDTVTGETKTAYTRIYGEPENGRVIKNNLNKPFNSMD